MISTVQKENTTMKRYNFTLTELLVTIGIIIILAGLAIPAVLVAQQKGRVTAAKADMNAILTALKGVEGTYHKMVNGGTSAKFANKSAAKYPATGSVGIRLGGTDAADAYDNFIVELSDPSHADLINGSGKFIGNINRRKIKFLDPKSDYDPSETIAVNSENGNLWRDPWGNRYVLIINTDFSGKLPRPYDTNKFLAANAIMYSFGPDGEDNSGQSTDYDDNDGDDICSWR